ncbi:MAG: helix-turn-helix domain-containing protein [Bacteroidetes bacterium]|nr:helix-turn-helix domain-containing protein [Bacteroidota bacterium]
MNTHILPIGLIISQLIDEKRLKKKDVAERLGKGRQYIYDTFSRKTMTYEELENWANALEVTVEEIERRQKQEQNEGQNSLEKNEKTSLMLLIEEMRMTIKDLRETVKSQAHTIEVLAGKSGSVPLARFVAFPLFFCG